MQRDSLTIARGVVGLGSLMLLVATVGLAFDVVSGHYPLGQISGFNYTTGRFMADMMNRGLHQVLAITFTVVAIAVPLTANLYSLKFLEFFIKDRINAFMLTLVVSADMASFWMIYSIKENAVPVFLLHLVFSLLLLCLSLLFPYLYYVFRFLHPNTLLERLEAEITDDLRAAARTPRRAGRYRRSVADGIEHIANMAIRSIDRTDRNTAIESVLTMERVARAYWQLKEQLPPAWFVADTSFFLGFSSRAVEDFTASRSWAEMKLLSQLRQVMSAAIPRMHDVIDTIAKVLRKLGSEEIAHHDTALREIIMEYFNTFLRLALSRRDARSAFSLLDHYRTYATALNADFPDFVLEIAYYFEFYGHLARDSQITFIVEAVAHDLSALVWAAWEAHAVNRAKLLERFLHYDAQSPHPMLGVKKSQAILASYLLQAGETESVEQIRRAFARLEPSVIATLRDDLLHIKRERYWEIIERRNNIYFVPEPQRAKLVEFLDSLRAQAA